MACGRVQRSVRCGTPSERASRFDRERFAPRFRAQAMIDGDGDELRPALERLAPARGKHQERGRIGPAGDGKNEHRIGGKTGEKRSASAA